MPSSEKLKNNELCFLNILFGMFELSYISNQNN